MIHPFVSTRAPRSAYEPLKPGTFTIQREGAEPRAFASASRGVHVLHFCLGDNPTEVAGRDLAFKAGLDHHAVFTGRTTPADLEAMRKAMEANQHMPLWLVDDLLWTADELAEAIRKAIQVHADAGSTIGLVSVSGICRLHDDQDDAEEALRDLAAELGVAILSGVSA